MEGRLPTFALRRCGCCERPLGVALWPWSGRLFVTTHGLCHRCYDLLVAERPRRGAKAVRPARRI